MKEMETEDWERMKDEYKETRKRDGNEIRGKEIKKV